MAANPVDGKSLARLIVCLLALALAGIAQPQGRSRGDARLTVDYQYIRTGDFYDSNVTLDVGNTDSHILLFDGDYALSEQWTIFASLPYVQKRHTGANPHNFLEFVNYDPPDRRLIDDGNYHGGLQDLTVGMQYLVVHGPFSISPYVSYGVPASNYPFYGKAAIGVNLWRVPVGVALDFLPYFSDWHFSGSVAYVFSEKPLGVNVNHWLIYASAGYYFTPRFAANLFLSIKNTPDGLRLPESFTDDPTYQQLEDFDTATWWQHDREIQHNFTNAGVGVDYILNEKYQVSATVFTTVRATQTNDVDYAFTFGITRLFGGD